jgi:hypothetical protein
VIVVDVFLSHRAHIFYHCLLHLLAGRLKTIPLNFNDVALFLKRHGVSARPRNTFDRDGESIESLNFNDRTTVPACRPEDDLMHHSLIWTLCRMLSQRPRRQDMRISDHKTQIQG